MSESIVYDLILLEADRINFYRKREIDLFYRNHFGDIVPLAEAYSEEVQPIIDQIFKKKKMRYYMTFTEGLEVMSTLKGSEIKVLLFLCRQMSYGNVVKNYGIRDINDATSINSSYVIKAITQLSKLDIIRHRTDKGRRTYMVNPAYFYKGTFKKLFYHIKKFDTFPSLAPNKKGTIDLKDTIF
jgi:DNA-binding MarR family transcriptional regulator